MEPEDYNEETVHKLYDEALNRKDTYNGERVTIKGLRSLARSNGYQLPSETLNTKTQHQPFDLQSSKPTYYPNGMQPRKFLGPKIGKAQLFPAEAISLLVAIGSGGKTTTLISMTAHMGAGKNWDDTIFYPTKCILFCVEENQEELNRKFCAATHHFNDAERDLAIDNIRLVSCVGRDSRLTIANGRAIESSGLVEQIIAAAKEFEAQIVIIDHIQGFVSGDLNNSDTATALGIDANKIVSATGAAVVLAAHAAKHNINAESVSHGFTTGSFAFENLARQVTGIISLPDADAKKFSLEATKSDFRRIEIPKNSYGTPGAVGYLQTCPISIFHTVTLLPYAPNLVSSRGIQTKEERLRNTIIDLIRSGDCNTPAKLDELSGRKGHLQASKADVHKVRDSLLADGEIKIVDPTPEQRKQLRLNRQVRKIYVIGESAMCAIKPAISTQPEAVNLVLEGSNHD